MPDSEDVKNLPPSAKLVYKVLEYEQPLTQDQLIEESYLPGRTVRYALEQLRDIDAIEEDAYLPDMRKTMYSISTDHSE